MKATGDAAGQDRRAVVHVVDDDSSVRTALARLIGTAGFDARCYASAAEFLVAERGSEPACIVLDVGLPGLSGLDLHAALLRTGDRTPVVFLTGRGSIAMGVNAMKTGAVDFLTKPVKREALMAALDAALARDVDRRLRSGELSRVRERFTRLTPREREVFSRVTQGKLNKQIADELGTSVRTIKAHRAQVMTKMEVRSVADLVGMAAALRADDAI
jgi:FixJ family two-component response regulator